MIRRLALLLVHVLLVMGVAPAASAAWTSGGATGATVAATSVNPGNAPTATRNAGAVALQWAASSLANGAQVDRYDVIRRVGTTTKTVCTGATTTSCSDSNPMPGQVAYTVVPRIGQHWVGAASSSTAFQYDTFAPTTAVTTLDPSPNSAGWNKADVTVTLTATDLAPVASGVKEIHYTLNGVHNTVSGATATFTVGAEQVTDIEFWAVDQLNNAEVPKSTQTIKLDKTAPSTSATLNPSPNVLGWNNTNVNVSLNGTDALSGISKTEFSTDGGATWATYSATIYPTGIPFTAEGDVTVTFRSTDVAGNIETNRTLAVKIDKMAPTSSGSLTGNTVTLSASDPTSGGVSSGLDRIEYKIGSASTYTTYVNPFALTSGQTVAYRAVDKAGNIESPENTMAGPSGDTTSPTVTITGPTADVNNRPGQGSGRWSQVCGPSGGTGVCGTAADTSGIAQVQIKLQRASDNACWTGDTTGTVWSTTACSGWLGVTGSTTWYRAIPYSVIAGQSLTLSARATDTASPANTSTPVTMAFTAE